VQELDACPLCRTVLSVASSQCPGCGADLSPYRDLSVLAASYLSLASELLSRGELPAARQIIERLPQLVEVNSGELIALTARLLLLEGNTQGVETLLAKCSPAVAAEVRTELEERNRDRRRAQELYNHALTAAREGAYMPAAQHLARAVCYETSDPSIWALKLKVELKAALYDRCYRSLAELDRLGARPPEFHRLEELLPPVGATTT
jgi:hypothetical protein